MPPGFFICLAAVLYLITGCAKLSPAARLTQAHDLAIQSGWQSTRLQAGRFELLALHPPPVHTEMLTLYFEGDGRAWLDPRTPASDPTPLDPLALRLALKEGQAVSAYLARPCQYVHDSIRAQCSPADWTQARFSAEIVDAMNLAVDAMKQRFGARSIRLVGYSGGAAVAALVAARRQDVVQLVSVAGVLDHVGWARGLEVSPLSGSLNPADYWQVLQHLPQRHFVGGRDRQTGMHGIAGYLARFPPGLAPEVVVIDDFDHACCWEAAWPISSVSSDSAR